MESQWIHEKLFPAKLNYAFIQWPLPFMNLVSKLLQGLSVHLFFEYLTRGAVISDWSFLSSLMVSLIK